MLIRDDRHVDRPGLLPGRPPWIRGRRRDWPKLHPRGTSAPSGVAQAAPIGCPLLSPARSQLRPVNQETREVGGRPERSRRRRLGSASGEAASSNPPPRGTQKATPSVPAASPRVSPAGHIGRSIARLSSLQSAAGGGLPTLQGWCEAGERCEVPNSSRAFLEEERRIQGRQAGRLTPGLPGK